ncbi:MAG: hypothetical protein SOZ62_04980 [Eubacteriales bacterium]|nr:hypothetical protein [Eubacteriales bacterium]
MKKEKKNGKIKTGGVKENKRNKEPGAEKTKRKNYILNEIRGIYLVSKRRRSSFVVRILLITIVLAIAVLQAFNANYESCMVCVYAFVLFMLPPFVEKNFGFSLPMPLEILILFFIFAAEIIGEIMGGYQKFPGWDVMLHAINGFTCSAIGFALLDMFNRNRQEKFKLPPMFLTLVAFCFSMTIGVLWEFFEFSVDFILNMDMQKDTWIATISSVELTSVKGSAARTGIFSDIIETWIKTADGRFTRINPTDANGNVVAGYLDVGLIDTMKDLFVNFIGAVAFSIIGYIYVKTRKFRFAEYFIPTVKSKTEMEVDKERLDYELNRKRIEQEERDRIVRSLVAKSADDTDTQNTEVFEPADEEKSCDGDICTEIDNENKKGI